VEDQVAGDLEQEVTDEEQAGPETVDAPEGVGVDAEHLAQMQLGEADVDPIDVGDEVAHEQQREQPPADLGHQPAFQFVAHEKRDRRRLVYGVDTDWPNSA